MEHISDSTTVKDYLTQQLSGGSGSDKAGAAGAAVNDCTDNTPDTAADAGGISAALLKLAKEIGRILGTMHANHIIHGDLTTSNLLLEGRPEDCRIAVIDFGLGSYDESTEDKGVDLYVLERALSSTHPKTERFFEVILDGYKDAYEQADSNRGAAGDRKRGKKPSAEQVINKLNEVRMRGRKRTMVG
jgi:TP53 regulating kinase-like protein